jgi:hypothetical protein
MFATLIELDRFPMTGSRPFAHDQPLHTPAVRAGAEWSRRMATSR